MTLFRSLVQWFRFTAAAESPSTLAKSQALAAEPTVPIYFRSPTSAPLRTGEILSGVIQHRRSFKSLGLENPVIEEIKHPYSVVVTQDCDLEQDYFAREKAKNTEKAEDKRKLENKQIPNVLLVQATTVEELIASLPRGGDILKRVIQNKDERYHALEKVPASADAQGNGLPALGIDFKRYFTVPTEELYAQLSSGTTRRTHLNSPYLEHFARRFADFLSRVGLPKEHQVE